LFSNNIHPILSSIEEDLNYGGVVVSGYANMTNIASQPFPSENIIVFTDGYCASACTILLHLLKYQGKVKQIVAGGRPQSGPMQAIGGIKGSQVLGLATVLQVTDEFVQRASDEQIKQANQTTLAELYQYGTIVQNRNDANVVPVQVNL
jgi:hypothetical protein